MANNAPMTHEDHWSRPVAMTPDGQWISLREVVEEEPTQVPFNRLSPEKQSELVAERIRQSPEFDVGILGQGIVDKKHAITVFVHLQLIQNGEIKKQKSSNSR
jgi:hypothetical protein